MFVRMLLRRRIRRLRDWRRSKIDTLVDNILALSIMIASEVCLNMGMHCAGK
jgi:hypothetical protein